MPKLLKTPFAAEAAEGYRTDVQESTGVAPNSATYQIGFPPITMQSIASNGMPPKGSDLNGVLYDVTDNLVFLTQGGGYGFDSAYATSIGGYPLNAKLRLNDGTEVISTIANNTNDPNVNLTGWVKTNSASQILDESGLSQQEINNLFSSQSVNILSVYGGIDDFGVAIELAYAKATTLGLSTIFIPTRNYTAKTTANISLDRPFELKFGSNVVVYTVNEIDVFDIDMSHHFLSVNAEEAVFIPNWSIKTGINSVFKLNSRTLSKSCLIRGVSCIESAGVRFHHAINSQGLNYSLIRDCLFQAFDPIVNASNPNNDGHSMGSVVKDCFLHAHDEDGTPVTLINNGALACEGWSFEGGEYFGATGLKVVNNLTSAGYYPPLLRVSNVHMNCKQFAKLNGVTRVQFIGCDLQSRVMLNNPHSGLFELTGVQSFVLGAGTTITQAPTTGVVPQDSISVFSFKNAANGMVSAFASIDGASLWLYQNAPLVKFESDECYVGKVIIGPINTDSFTAKFSDEQYNSKISLIENTRISDANISTGVGVSYDVSFDSVTGVLTLNKSPSLGNVYQVYSSVVPNGSVIKKIKSSLTIGKTFKVVIEASNVSIEHSATLYTPAQSVNRILYGATLDCFSYNSDICRINQITANTTILPVSTPPATTNTGGVHGQKIFNAGFVYEYFVGTGWVRYSASTF